MRVKNLGDTRQVGRFGTVDQNATIEVTPQEFETLRDNAGWEIIGGWRLIQGFGYIRHPNTNLDHMIRPVVESGTLSFEIALADGTEVTGLESTVAFEEPYYVLLEWDSLGLGVGPLSVFRIFRDGVLLATVPFDSLSYQDDTVESGQEYQYTVKFYN
jgi:hypothetical protein